MEGIFGKRALTWGALAIAFAAQACGGVVQTRAEYDAQSCVERALRRGGDKASLGMARDKFQGDCKSGDAAACSQLGVMYEKGLAVTQSTERARDLYSDACDQANMSACVNYGLLLTQGYPLASNSGSSRVSPMDHAVRLFSTACREGDARACGELGRLYLVRKGDAARSVVMLRQACNGGYADSCFLLGAQYDHGQLGDDPVAAMGLYEKACAKGHEKGCFHVDLIYAKIAAQRSNVRVAVPATTPCRVGQACRNRVAQRPAVAYAPRRN